MDPHSLETQDLFHPLQLGFCCKHSCSALLAQLRDLWFSAINRSDLSKDVFLDLKNRRRKKERLILLITKSFKAFCLFIQFELIAFFCSYLKNRVQGVFIRGSYSSEGTVKHGVPKGSVLGPVLFCIYINDLPLHIPSNFAECHMPTDDTTLHTTGKGVVQIQKTLQLCLDGISVWCNTNHMLINTVKTKSKVITTRQRHSSQSCH